MSYQVRLRRGAGKELDKLVGQDYEIIANAISALEQEPRPARVKKLAESGLWRIRLGRYRIIYAIDEERQVIIVRIAKRREDTYKGL